MFDVFFLITFLSTEKIALRAAHAIERHSVSEVHLLLPYQSPAN